MAEQQGRRPHGRTFCLSVLHLSALLPSCLAAVFLSGCAHAAAKTTPDMPGLAMPAPPPRDVEPTEVEPPAPMPLAAEPARNTSPRARPAPPPIRIEPKAEPPKAEQPPTPAPAPVEAPKIEEAPKPPTTLQTTPATAEGEVERVIRASLQRATTDLNRVDYRALNADARAQYDQAKRWVTQADDSIRTKNLQFAKILAEKAATIAAQLAGR